MTLNQKYKLGDLAKDLGMKSGELIDLLAKNGFPGRKVGSQLDSVEFDIIMNAVTAARQIDDIDEYLSGKITISVPRPEPAPEPAVSAETEQAASDTSAPTAQGEAKQARSAQTAQSQQKQSQRQSGAGGRQPQTQQGGKGQQQSSHPQQAQQSGKQQQTQQGGRSQQAQQSGRQAQKTGGQQKEKQAEQTSAQLSARQDEQIRKTAETAKHETDTKAKPEERVSAREARFDKKPDLSQQKQKQQKRKAATQKQKQQPAAVHTPTTSDEPAVKIIEGERSHHRGKASGTRVVDTRTTTVNLDKYDEKLDKFVPDTEKDISGEKQKLKKQNTRVGTDGKRSRGRGRASAESEKLRRLELEKAKKKPLEITLPDEILVSELASRLKMTAASVIKKLIGMGFMVTANQKIDFETAALVAEEFNAKVEREVVVTIEDKLFDDTVDKEEDLVPRAPVVVVMGHVDHGKTSLLDRIRQANVTATEAGGITQHIGAYRVNVSGREITFLDTPGHEAFTTMRARGARATDIAILVVAADDGIMPQTVEAINHAKAAEIDIVVAINKMDKPGVDPERIKQELTKYELVPEEWGGDVMCVPISALTGQGIDDLLESVLLIADLKELKANPNRRAKGIVIESQLDRGRGPVATVLVQNGTLHYGDIVIAGTAVGRVRAMVNDKGETVKTAGPSEPVEIIGLSEVPTAGDEFHAVEDERMARELAEQRKERQREEEIMASSKVSLDELFAQIQEGAKELNIIVKGDVDGSAEAVKTSLLKLSTDEVKVKVIHSGVGGISDSDVMLAAASNAIIVGFNVRPDRGAMESAERHKVEIRTYRVIYDCIEEISAALKGMLEPTYREELLGHAEVRQVIRVPKVGPVAGSYVLDGKITRNAKVRVVRDGIVIFEDQIASLRRFKDDVREVAAGYECGIGLEKFTDIRENDILEAYEMVEVQD
ncbi:MAG: translation initiation factor IF-2 [Eubacteriales bacterium]|jgi:translation initiation factor IF-2